MIKKPDSLNGKSFQICDCTNCIIYILDWTATVYVDDCVNCKIFLGPVETSAFIRTCTDCQMIIACG